MSTRKQLSAERFIRIWQTARTVAEAAAPLPPHLRHGTLRFIEDEDGDCIFEVDYYLSAFST